VVGEFAAQDKALLDRCLRGERSAWEEFVRRYHPALEAAVRFTFLRLIHSAPEADIEGVVQDLYTRLYEDDFRRLRTWEARCPLAAWLKSLAVRHTLNTVRDEKRRGRYGGGNLDDLPLRPAAESEERVSLEERDEISRLDILIDQLGPLQRTTLRMFYHDGLAYREIARALGISIQTVGSLISRARDRLRSMMGRSE
jgi:RNA polymerase sigma-70 factor (ECF subfamily)